MATTTQHYHTIRAHNFMIYTFYDSSVSFPFVSSRFGFAGSIPSGCELVWEEHFRQEHFGGECRRRSYCTPSPVSTSEPASQPAIERTKPLGRLHLLRGQFGRSCSTFDELSGEKYLANERALECNSGAPEVAAPNEAHISSYRR